MKWNETHLTKRVVPGLADKEGSSIEIAGSSTYEYTYSIRTDNKNSRTLQGFSLQADKKMNSCANCPYKMFKKYKDYYGVTDYGNEWIVAAFEGTKTSFANGNADFDNYQNVGRHGEFHTAEIPFRHWTLESHFFFLSEAVKKGSAYMNVWMYVIYEMEHALDTCELGDKAEYNPVHFWDEAVAFYTGSKEGVDGAGVGKLLHALADKRCNNFRTCGDLNDRVHGHAYVTKQIFADFKTGQDQLGNKKCADARKTKERIENRMAVPLIQGTLRYAYERPNLEDNEKSESEGATFAASVLPLVHACSKKDASIIYDNMKVGSSTPDFTAVKKAFERNYNCMKVRCVEVGGYYNDAEAKYHDGAEPCTFSEKSKGSKVGLAVGLSFGFLAVAAAGLFYFYKKGKASKMAPKDPQFEEGAATNSEVSGDVEVEVREMS